MGTPVTLVDANGNAVPLSGDGALKVVDDGTPPYTVAAGQTAAPLGAEGAAGDYISHVVIIPATTSPGAVAILDDDTSYTIFAGGASSVSNLAPITVPLGWVSQDGGWSVTTGTNVSVRVAGRFTEE